MQPQNPYQAPVQPPNQPGQSRPVQPSDYEFIFNNQKKSHRLTSKFSFRNNKLLVVVLVLLVPLLIFGAYSLFFNRGDGNTTLMTTVAQQQTEVVRVADLVLAQTNLKDETRAIATNSWVTVNSDLSQLKAYMSKNGHELKDKQLQAGKNSSIDDNLGQANQSGNLDSAYLTVLKAQLNDYESALTAAYQATTGPNGQQVLSNAYDNVQLLKKQVE